VCMSAHILEDCNSKNFREAVHVGKNNTIDWNAVAVYVN